MNRNATKLAVVFSLVCLSLPGVCIAQGSNAQGARKFDEFGDLQISDIIARLDNFAIQLQQEPDTRGFIMIYRARRDLPGLNSRLADRMKRYMVDSRGVAADRVVTIDGGVASALVQELWIVPVGSTPKPRDDVYTGPLIDTESAWKFDEHFVPSPRDEMGEVNYPLGSSLEAYAEVLRKYPNSHAYIIAYPQYSRGRGQLDRRGTATKMLGAVRRNLVDEYRIPRSRIKTVNGGYRKLRQIELWIVPRCEHAPIATPNAFPKKRR